MATASSYVGCSAGHGLGALSVLCEVYIATITVENAVATMTADYGLTIAGVSSITDSTCYVAAQGANIHHTDGDGAESESGIALTATFTDI